MAALHDPVGPLAAGDHLRHDSPSQQNHHYAIIFVHLILNTALKSRNPLLVTGYRLLKKLSKFKILSHSLPH